jgi:hypothetical protein
VVWNKKNLWMEGDCRMLVIQNDELDTQEIVHKGNPYHSKHRQKSPQERT